MTGRKRDHSARLEIVDTYPAFRAFWANAQPRPVDEQITAWATEYMAAWPELLEKQQQDYANENQDWRQVARERVFPYLNDRLEAMQEAHKHLINACAPVYSFAGDRLAFDSKITFVIYVGIGCGAGWATQYQKQPAVLFGLENIAECGWAELETLSGLVAHEIGHLVHDQWRERCAAEAEYDPWWQLYREGFAQRCEHIILGRETWHMSRGGDWLDWCRDHIQWLAGEFLRHVATEATTRPFFGSWFEIRGRRQTGFFLGHELLKRLEQRMTFKELAQMKGIEPILRCELEGLAGKSA